MDCIQILYSTGICFHKNYRTLKQQQSRTVNLSLFIRHKTGMHIQDDDGITLELQKSLNVEGVRPILSAFAEQLGNKKRSGDLEYIQKTFGSLCLSVVRHSKRDRIMTGTFQFDLENTLPAVGFDQGMKLCTFQFCRLWWSLLLFNHRLHFTKRNL